MSGRGLGHTGGTLDKLESIPGVCVEQPVDRFKEIVKQQGICVIGQSGNLVPADKKMYALRDVTGTVKSIPLIASSIMSKKLAAGADAIVLDVKTGSGAFMETREEAQQLADIMVDIGCHLNRKVSAIVTDMNQPLGNAIGNALEVREAVQALSGELSLEAPLMQVSFQLGSEMLVLAELAKDRGEAIQLLKDALYSGAGLEKLKQMILSLGGDASYIDPVRINELCKINKVQDVCAQKSGIIVSMDTEKIGTAAQMLGAGRATKADAIDPAVGIIMKKRLGDSVSMGEAMACMYINDNKNEAAAIALLQEAMVIQ